MGRNNILLALCVLKIMSRKQISAALRSVKKNLLRKNPQPRPLFKLNGCSLNNILSSQMKDVQNHVQIFHDIFNEFIEFDSLELRLYMDFDILLGLGPVRISKSIYSLNSRAIDSHEYLIYSQIFQSLRHALCLMTLLWSFHGHISRSVLCHSTVLSD